MAVVGEFLCIRRELREIRVAELFQREPTKWRTIYVLFIFWIIRKGYLLSNVKRRLVKRWLCFRFRIIFLSGSLARACQSYVPLWPHRFQAYVLSAPALLCRLACIGAISYFVRAPQLLLYVAEAAHKEACQRVVRLSLRSHSKSVPRRVLCNCDVCV